MLQHLSPRSNRGACPLAPAATRLIGRQLKAVHALQRNGGDEIALTRHTALDKEAADTDRPLTYADCQ